MYVSTYTRNSASVAKRKSSGFLIRGPRVRIAPGLHLLRNFNMGEVISLFRYEVFVYPWGTAVQEARTKKWIVAFIGGQEINLEKINVEIHENGIEFL